MVSERSAVRHERRATPYSWTGLAGIVGTLFIAAGLILIGRAPSPQAPAVEYTHYYFQRHNHLLAGVSATALGLSLTLCFLTGLRAALREAQGRGTDLPTIGLVAGATRVVVLLTGGTFLLAPAYRFGQGDVWTARSMADLFAMTTVLSALPTVISSLAFGAAILRSRVLPPWLGGLSLIVAAAHLFACGLFAQSGPLAPAGFVEALLIPSIYYAWVAVVSLVLLLRPAAR